MFCPIVSEFDSLLKTKKLAPNRVATKLAGRYRRDRMVRRRTFRLTLALVRWYSQSMAYEDCGCG